MKNECLKISLRQSAIWIHSEELLSEKKQLSKMTMSLISNVSELGFVFDEKALMAINQQKPNQQLVLFETLKEITGVNKNWTPLVKDWSKPTGETRKDHLFTFFTNVFNGINGTVLKCGHKIPDGTFPLERYNGCPFCGTPFVFEQLELKNQGSTKKILTLWTETDAFEFYKALLSSKTALDATQVDSLKTLINYFDLPEGLAIAMNETRMMVIDHLVVMEKIEEAGTFFQTPNDILRYLWFKHTGNLQLIQPKVLIERMIQNYENTHSTVRNNTVTKQYAKRTLKLKYSRKQCKMVAKWMENLPLTANKMCEIMHPKREMWVRFIRALRLAEYSQKRGFEHLKQMLDVFYNQTYEVFEGRVQYYRLKSDANNTFRLLQSRPGLFARSLFANMLWFGPEVTIKHFIEIIDQIPLRLMITLNMYAPIYFNKQGNRLVSPLGGTNKRIPTNKLLGLYKENEVIRMVEAIERLCLEIVKLRFQKETNENTTMFIDPILHYMPLSIGDRSETVQDLPTALMGTRFKVEGEKVRLFMQWGEGLSAQHLDMDLSCVVAYKNHVDRCSYSQLTAPGCQHSGDIQSIPEKVGTAEYIDIHVGELKKKGAKYVTFTCNAYSQGSISPNLVVGWMNSKYEMSISSKSGVAYDPSCVQHQVRVQQSATKGLVFGVLDVMAEEIIWLEMSFGGQVIQNLDLKGVETLLSKLNSKMSIGALLKIKANAQNLDIVSEIELADEVYDQTWAQNTAAVTQLFVD
ncbi:MAG: hypothetical protein ACPG6V_11440 [Flavobacteriales bacterium]